MKASKLAKMREMSVDELRSQESELISQLFNLRMQLAIGQGEKTSKVSTVRKDLARIKTLIGQRQRAAKA